MKQTVAIIGSGAAGLASAFYLKDRFDVHLFESNPSCGGHANTITVEDTDGSHAIDTGFIVFNKPNYPHFVSLLNNLNVPYQTSDMSFAYHDKPNNHYYCSDFPRGIFAEKKLLVSPTYWRFLGELFRFKYLAQQTLNAPGSLTTLSDFLDYYNFSPYFKETYVLPMGAAIWSLSINDTLQFPLLSFLRFWDNHKLLNLIKRPQWQTVSNGSQAYVSAILSHLQNVHCNQKVHSVAKKETRAINTPFS